MKTLESTSDSEPMSCAVGATLRRRATTHKVSTGVQGSPWQGRVSDGENPADPGCARQHRIPLWTRLDAVWLNVWCIALALLAAGCCNAPPGDDGLQMCQPDGTACTTDEQCCGSAEPKPAWGGKLENVHGACKLAGKCCTWFEESGWITLLCGDESVSFPPQTH